MTSEECIALAETLTKEVKRLEAIIDESAGEVAPTRKFRTASVAAINDDGSVLVWMDSVIWATIEWLQTGRSL